MNACCQPRFSFHARRKSRSENQNTILICQLDFLLNFSVSLNDNRYNFSLRWKTPPCSSVFPAVNNLMHHSTSSRSTFHEKSCTFKHIIAALNRNSNFATKEGDADLRTVKANQQSWVRPANSDQCLAIPFLLSTVEIR